MVKEDFNRINGLSMPQIRTNCSDPKKAKTAPSCDCHNPGKTILDYQTSVSKCEAELFCSATDRLVCELCKAQTLCELKQIFELMNGLLTSSAAKEFSLAEIIKASNISKKVDQKCDC